MKVHVLGSGDLCPSLTPALRERGENYLFDAGEGTQLRMAEAEISRADLEAIFISHMHGDHVLGLPGLLIRRSRESGKTPLELFGPRSLKEFVDDVDRTVGINCQFDLRFTPLEKEHLFTLGNVWVGTVAGDHRVPSNGFVICSREKKRKFHPEKARELEIPEGPIWGQLQDGQTVTLDHGRTIEPEQVSDPPEPPPKVVYLPDTRPLDNYP
ncbi:MAG: MBL fold metallo-hydrolase, partial [bacterium]